MTAKTSSPLSTTRKHAIVVGSGLAGLSAASELIARNIPVHMLERSAKPGGNSMKASSGINGAPTRFQPRQPFVDTSFYDDTLKSVGPVIAQATEKRKELITTLTNSSQNAVNWLVDDKGIDLSVVAQLGGHSFPRTHRGAGKIPPGAAIVTTLLKSLQQSPLFHLDTSAVVTKILQDGVGVEGVEYVINSETKSLHGPVIVSSGGFGGDSVGMLALYRPDLAGFPSTNEPRPGSQALLTAVGAQLIDMDRVQVHPTSFVDPKDSLNHNKFLAAEMLRGEGAILLHNGKRVVNEMETRKKITESIMKLEIKEEAPKQWDVQLVLDEGVYEKASSHIDFYIWKGLMHKTTIGEVGEAALESIREYSEIVKGNVADSFGRSSFGHWTLDHANKDSVIYVGEFML